MRVTFDLPDGCRLPRIIDCTLPHQVLSVLEGKATFRAVTLSNGSILKVIVPNEVPVFTVQVAETPK